MCLNDVLNPPCLSFGPLAQYDDVVGMMNTILNVCVFAIVRLALNQSMS